MKNLIAFFAVVGLFAAGSGWASTVTLQFHPNDIFNYATTDDTRINQQGTARLISTYTDDVSHTLKNVFQTYTDGPGIINHAAIASILGWTGAWAGYQGISQLDVWLWGGKNYEVAMKPGTAVSTSHNGEAGWTTYTYNFGAGLFDAIYNTVLGATPPWYALSPVFQPADKLWSVTGDFFIDGNGNGIHDAGEAELLAGQQYTMWFSANLNNWPDGGSPSGWGPAVVQGSIIGTVVPEPATLSLLGLGLAGLAGIGRKRRA